MAVVLDREESACVAAEWADLPITLTIAEAGSVLRIGRTTAYRLATRFQCGDPTGLPVALIAGCLRVPRWALIVYIRSGRVEEDVQLRVDAELDAQLTAATDTRDSRSRRPATRATQLSLLESR
jgi:hypothetical protein